MSQAMFKLFGSIQKVEDNDDGTITVYGVASSGARDHADEIVAPEAMKAALPDYHKFPALREMHQPLAAGRVVEADVDDDGITNIAALVVDPLAITKVKTGVYSGFSIGGKVTKRDPADRSIITGLRLVEISLVDSPCNPDAVLSMWKADTMTTEFKPESADVIARAKALAKAAGTARFKDFLFEAGQELTAEYLLEKGEIEPPMIEPEPAAEEPAKEAAAEAVVEQPAVAVEKPVEGEEAKEAAAEPDEDDHGGEGAVEDDDEGKEAASDANPLAAALEAAINKAGDVVDAAAPASDEVPNPFADAAKAAAALKGITFGEGAINKSLWHVGRFAELLSSFACLQECAQCEANYEGDNSPIPAQLAAAIGNLGTILVAMAQEEVAEMLAEMKGADGVEIIFIGDEIDLANTIVDAVKADDDLMGKAAERVAPAAAPEDEAEKAARIAELESENETLSKALQDAAPAVEELTRKFQERFDELAAKFDALDKTVLPAKTAGPAVARVVAKGEDSTGNAALNPDDRFAGLTPEQFEKAWNLLSDEERGLILVKASLANPKAVTR